MAKLTITRGRRRYSPMLQYQRRGQLFTLRSDGTILHKFDDRWVVHATLADRSPDGIRAAYWRRKHGSDIWRDFGIPLHLRVDTR